MSSSIMVRLHTIALTVALAQTQGVPMTTPTMRGGRYCEIVWAGPVDVANGVVPTSATVSWNGTGGVCPSNPGYYNITDSDVRAVHGRDADAIVWNGLRQWTLDAIVLQEENSSMEVDSVYYEYGKNIFPDGSGLIMRRQATVTLPPGGVGGAGNRYRPNLVQRNATTVWKAGTTVYDLVSPSCEDVYVMQSFFIGRPGGFSGLESEADLPDLETRGVIDPPEGWVYRTRELEGDLIVKGTDGVTGVLQDDVGNSYSAVDKPFNCDICPGGCDPTVSPTPEPTEQPMEEDTFNPTSRPTSNAGPISITSTGTNWIGCVCTMAAALLLLCVM